MSRVSSLSIPPYPRGDHDLALDTPQKMTTKVSKRHPALGDYRKKPAARPDSTERRKNKKPEAPTTIALSIGDQGRVNRNKMIAADLRQTCNPVHEGLPHLEGDGRAEQDEVLKLRVSRNT